MSKKNSFTLRETADSDLEKIFHYSVENWGEDRASQYIYTLVDSFQQLADGSMMGDDYGHIRPHLYACRVASHRVFYKMTEEGVSIYRVLHQAMDFKRHF